MKEEIFLQQETLADLFTLVYVLVDDYLKALEKENICILPKAENQVGSYSELMTIALVGELLKEPYIGQWYEFVKVEYKHLFPKLPDTSRFYRIMNKLERIFADFALRFAPLSHAENYVIDSKALKHCHHKRVKRARQMSEADFGYSSMGMFYGFKLHGIVSEQGVFCRFLIAPANVSDQEAAASLEADAFVLGDKNYNGTFVHAQPKKNYKHKVLWTQAHSWARKTIETVFSSLVRSRHLHLGQLDSFRSVRAHVCRKIAAHNLAWFLVH